VNDVNNQLQIRSNPELGYQEFQARGNIVSLLQSHSIPVTPHAYSRPTSFQTEYGTGGCVFTYCAEYDALPQIGHACGHNLIAPASLATASIASFLFPVEALKLSKIPGRVRLLGTPAEECGGGKIRLIEAGAFKDVDATLMIHPTTPRPDGKASVSY
jgi:metal-dependent amidase/aminoacylase/carboxypeptidase family protein